MKIETLFATVDGGKVIDPTVDNKLADKVKASNVPTNKELTILTQYIDSVTGTVISKEEHQRKFDSKEEEFTVFLDLPKNTLKDGQELVATHIIYEDKEKTKEVVRHYDLTNKDQTVTAKTPKTPTTPAQSTPTKGSFPSTGEMIQSTFAMIGLMILTVVGYFFVSKKAEAELA
ncbi:LPXTG cell wall anchor domain-containing protein [Enterococcus termitis]